MENSSISTARVSLGLGKMQIGSQQQQQHARSVHLNDKDSTSSKTTDSGGPSLGSGYNGSEQLSEVGIQTWHSQPVLTKDTMNPHVAAMQYILRGTIFRRAAELESEIKQGVEKPFEKVYRVNIGDCQECGQAPITFLRQVMALCAFPALLDSPEFPDDAKDRALRILNGVSGHSIGSYGESIGNDVIRQDVATYITKRDGGIPANYEDIVLFSGATHAAKLVLSLLMTGKDSPNQAGVLVPIPQYPMYSSTLAQHNGYMIPYYLDEDDNWALNIDELQRSLDKAKGHCIPRAIVVINPGNPTGQVLSRKNMENIIEFARRERLFILADEVYQQNVYGKHEFHSFKKVLKQMGDEYAHMQLASLMSMSKGYMGECGIRGGYCEFVNVDPAVLDYFHPLMPDCPSVFGQIAIEAVVNPPQPGEPSYDLFTQETNTVLGNLDLKARLTTEALNSIEGVRCNEVSGAMYAFPRISLPDGAIRQAQAAGMEPDVFYCTELLETTGICVVPGCGFGQQDGTYHFRMTILSSVDEQRLVLDRLKKFHVNFVAKHSS